MELIYIYSNAPFFPENGICLSNKYSVEFQKKENQFYAKQSAEKLPENFWSNEKIKSVVAFAGKNGAGKTKSICSSLYHFLAFGGNIRQGVLIYLDENDELKMVTTKSYSSCSFIFEGISGIEVEINVENSFDDLHAFFESIGYYDVLYFNNSLAGGFDPRPFGDISTEGLLYQSASKLLKEGRAEEKQNIINVFKEEETSRQIKYLDFIEEGQMGDVGILDHINFTIHTHYHYSSTYNTKFVKEITAFLSKPRAIGDLVIDEPVNITSFKNILFYILVCLRYKVFEEEILDLFKSASFSDDIGVVLSGQKTKLAYSSLRLLLEMIDTMEVKDISYPIYDAMDPKSLAALNFSIVRKDFVKFHKQLSSFLGQEINRVEFHWPISSGENAKLALYARIFEIRNPGNSKMLLILDEADAFYHPEWSRNLINDLLINIPKVTMNKKIQMVLTAHSPFILSDLPASCVYYLNRNNNEVSISQNVSKQTFAANIHDLLADSFFMENGFIGEFSKNYIQNLVRDIRNTKEVDEPIISDLRNRINIIGDEIIQLKLNQELEKAIELLKPKVLGDDKASLQKKKEFYELQLKLINKKLNDD
jgi:hypothetical protein